MDVRGADMDGVGARAGRSVLCNYIPVEFIHVSEIHGARHVGDIRLATFVINKVNSKVSSTLSAAEFVTSVSSNRSMNNTSVEVSLGT